MHQPAFGSRAGGDGAADGLGAFPHADQTVTGTVVVGGLARARTFDVGTPVYTKVMGAAELRKALGLKAK